MKKIGKLEFPETPEQAKKWTPTTAYSALHQFVVCVAHSRIEGKWRAYCKNVPGINHRQELEEVLAHGDQLDERVALAIFPLFTGIPYAR